MKNNIDYKKIFEDLTNKKVKEEEVLKLIELILIECDDDEIRSRAVELILEKSMCSDEAFRILEKSLISDESPIVRFSAIKVLVTCFSPKCKNLIKWVLDNENSIYFYKNLLDLLDNSKNAMLKGFYLRVIKKITQFYNLNEDDARFILDLDNIEYLKFREGFSTFIKQFNLNDNHVKELILEHEELGYKGLKSVQATQNGYITELNLTELPEIPKSIIKLRMLKSLKIQHSNLKNIPKKALNLENLDYLELSDNVLTFIPEWTWKYSKKEKNTVKYIDKGVLLEEAAILSLFEVLSGKNFIKTNDVRLKENVEGQFFSINSIGNITGISINHVDSPKIGIIPIQICQLKKLETLFLINQNITNIPECLLMMNSLKLLNLSVNKIKDLKLQGKTCKIIL